MRRKQSRLNLDFFVQIALPPLSPFSGHRWMTMDVGWFTIQNIKIKVKKDFHIKNREEFYHDYQSQYSSAQYIL